MVKEKVLPALDDEFAKKMGLPGIILHGLCTMAFTSHAVLSQVAPGRSERLKRLAVRFAAPGRPGQVMTTSMWRAGAKWWRISAVRSRRRRSHWTGCCSAAWRAGEPDLASTGTPSAMAATSRSASGSSSTSTT